MSQHRDSGDANSAYTGGQNHERSVTGTAPAVRAQIIEPGGSCNIYRVDPHGRGLVLEQVLHPTHARGADLARVPLLLPATPQNARERAQTLLRPRWGFQRLSEPPTAAQASVANGPALLLLVLSDPPLAPNTWVEVRLLGAVAMSTSPVSHVSPITNSDGASVWEAWEEREDKVEALAHWLAVGIPGADMALANIQSLASLPERLQICLEHTLSEMITISPQEAPQLSAEQIAALYRSARAQVRRQQRASQQTHDESEIPHERLFTPRADTVGGRFATAMGASQNFAPGSEGEDGSTGDKEGVTWQGLAGIGPAEVRARGIAAFGRAEHLLRRVPARFLRYLDELLPTNERVLFFADTEAFTVRGWTGELNASLGAQAQQQGRAKSSRWERALGTVGVGRMRARTLQAGLLLITDHQVMLLRDLAPPDATLVQWGYIAHSWPLGRLVAVHALPPGTDLNRAALVGWPARVMERLADPMLYDESTAPPSLARLALALEGSDGIAVSGAALPAKGAPVMARAERLLTGFCPWPGSAGAADRRVRAMPVVRPWRPTEEEVSALESLGGMVPEMVGQALTDVVARETPSDETVLVQARTPEMDANGAGKRGRTALLTLTPKRLLIAIMPNQPGAKSRVEPELRDIPLQSITSALLQHSVLGSGLVVYVTRAEHHPETSQLRISFPSPLIVPFRALFTRLGALLQTPPIT